ncbi:MAG: LTA synthase family protein [Candidatus Magasanikbacteria bacterium]|nr:LTA synthase family protein [Candidatus Magasanikbacteria bacterium]MBT4071678.1 LTA synthase family protein [Candidatus Magasanikbacteria bacterium]
MSYIHVVLDWDVWSFQIIFLFLFTVMYASLFSLCQRRVAQILFLLSSILFVLYALVNVVYVPVFHTILPLYFLGDSSFAFSMVKDFYREIPWHVYGISVVYLFVSYITWFFIGEKNIVKKKLIAVSMFMGSIVLGICVLLFTANAGLTESPEKRVARIGMHSGLVKQIYTDYLSTPSAGAVGGEVSMSDPIFSTRYVNEGVLPEVGDTPHIIFYQLESIPAWALSYGIEAMPFLQSLVEDGLSVNNAYPNGCHTIDAEFSTLCSRYPHSYRPIASIGTENDYYCLPHILKDDYGYGTAGFHANESKFWSRDKLFPKWGIDNLFFVPDTFDTPKIDDKEVVDYAVQYLSEQENPQMLYIVGYSSHAPHIYNQMEYLREVSGTEIDFYNGPLEDEFIPRVDVPVEGDIRAYLGFMEPIDRAIEALFTGLEEKGLRDNTIVVITGDHRYYDFYDSLSNVGNFKDTNTVPFVIVFPDSPGGTDDLLASHIDIAPTLLHAIEGDEYKKRDGFFGSSLFEGKVGDEVIMSCDKQIHLITPEGLSLYTNQDMPAMSVIENSRGLGNEELEDVSGRLRGVVLKSNEELVE